MERIGKIESLKREESLGKIGKDFLKFTKQKRERRNRFVKKIIG